MRTIKTARAILCGCLIGAGALVIIGKRIGAQSLVSPSYTTDQATSGKAAYGQRCESCHGSNLDDGQFAPPLQGIEFRQAWFGQPAEPLFNYMSEKMPPGGRREITDVTYLEILAYLLQQNGLTAGNTPLPSDPAALKSMLLPGLPGGVSGGLAGGVAVPAPPRTASPLARYTPVTDAMLRTPPESEWLTWRRTWDSHGFSPLKQITKANVAELRPAWSWSLPNGPNEGTPVFHDGVLFVHAYGDKVQALDAVTGDLLWQYTRRLPKDAPASVKRTIALYGDKVYVPTSDTHVVALDAKTGRVAWDHEVASRKDGYGMTGGPLVARGKVMVGTTGRAAGGNLIVALDAGSGEEAWRFNAIAQPNAPFGHSWNGVPVEKRNGASVWVAGSFDPATGLALFGVAQTYDTGPYRDLVKDVGVTNDLLYTDSTVAINPDTGKLAWHYQHQPNDQWDLDWAFEQVLLKLAGSTKTLVATAGKQAIYDVVEADTGKYVFSLDLGLQDIVTGIDPKTGAKTVNPRLIPGGGDTITVCPHAGGAKSWIPESYNPETKTMFVPLVESCMDLIPVAPGGRGSLSTGVRWALRPRAGSDGRYGRLQAIDFEARKVLWTNRQRAPQSTGMLATAGGVVFAGALDRVFAAYDDATGKELWRTRLNDVPNAAPISYSVNGRQYVAVTVGNGGAQAVTFPALVPEIRNPPDGGAAVWVFELGTRARAATTDK